MSIQNINPQDIKVQFGLPEHPEQDKKLLDLIVAAHTQQIPTYQAVIPIEIIKPFCAYKPKDDEHERFKVTFLADLNRGVPEKLYVYQDGDEFIMSDDYHSYFAYIEEGFKKVPCIVFGECDHPEVEFKEKIEWRL